MPVVTFLTDRFSNTPSADSFREVVGKDLSEWLRDGLQERGFEVSKAIATEYGYGFAVTRDKSRYWVVEDLYEPAIDPGDTLATWSVGIHYIPGCLSLERFRVRPTDGNQIAIAQAIHAMLENDLRISDVQWWARTVGRGDPSPVPQ